MTTHKESQSRLITAACALCFVAVSVTPFPVEGAEKGTA